MIEFPLRQYTISWKRMIEEKYQRQLSKCFTYKR